MRYGIRDYIKVLLVDWELRGRGSVSLGRLYRGAYEGAWCDCATQDALRRARLKFFRRLAEENLKIRYVIVLYLGLGTRSPPCALPPCVLREFEELLFDFRRGLYVRQEVLPGERPHLPERLPATEGFVVVECGDEVV